MVKKSLVNDNPVDGILPFLSTNLINPSTDIPIENRKEESQIHIPIQNRNKRDKNGKELKRKRYNLLFFPSLYNDLEKIAYVEKISINEAVNQAIAQYLAFIDETGDRGYSKKSSEYFAMAAVIFPASIQQKVKDCITEIKTKFGVPLHVPLHWRKHCQLHEFKNLL